MQIGALSDYFPGPDCLTMMVIFFSFGFRFLYPGTYDVQNRLSPHIPSEGGSFCPYECYGPFSEPNSKHSHVTSLLCVLSSS